MGTTIFAELQGARVVQLADELHDGGQADGSQ